LSLFFARLADLMPTEEELRQLNEDLKEKELTKINVDAQNATKKVFDDFEDQEDVLVTML
jgi:hypothetical protein